MNVETKNIIIDMGETLVMSFIVLFAIYSTIAFPEIVSGSSMEPSISDGERILVDKISGNLVDFKRGEIIVLNPPGTTNLDYIKRVIGVPGDVVKIYSCKVYIIQDKEKYILEETYLYDETCTNDGPSIKEGRSIRLGEDEFLVLGDNRNNSADSRILGLIKRDRIVGRAVFRFWPLTKFGVL